MEKAVIELIGKDASHDPATCNSFTVNYIR
jgi:hypothetical protein